MQLSQPRGNIIEKVLRNKDGQLVRAVFCVYETDGRVKARLLHTTVIESKDEVLILAGSTNAQKIQSQIVSYNAIKSPFLTSNSIYFSGSKPRAPTF